MMHNMFGRGQYRELGRDNIENVESYRQNSAGLLLQVIWPNSVPTQITWRFVLHFSTNTQTI